MKIKNWLRWLVGTVIAAAFLTGSAALAGETAQTAADDSPSVSAYKAVGLGAAAAIAIAVSVLGAGYAVGRIGAAALGAAAEKPELLARSILFVALAEGLAVLGFAIAMILVQKI
jgi:V/A-type H+-transporting ATPase subunit K